MTLTWGQSTSMIKELKSYPTVKWYWMTRADPVCRHCDPYPRSVRTSRSPRSSTQTSLTELRGLVNSYRKSITFLVIPVTTYISCLSSLSELSIPAFGFICYNTTSDEYKVSKIQFPLIRVFLTQNSSETFYVFYRSKSHNILFSPCPCV